MTEGSNVILLYGNDEYAMSRRLKKFESMFADTSAAEMNRAEFDAATMSEEDLNNALKALPFLADRRLVIVVNPSKRYVSRKAKAKVPVQGQAPTADQTALQDEERGEAETEDGDQAPEQALTQRREKFLELLGHLPPTTQVVITEVMELRTNADQKAAENHWLVKWLRNAGLGLERHALPLPRDMTGWIIKEAKAQGGILGQDAAKDLALMVGTDTRRAVQEIAKLLTYVNWSRPITAADVKALSPLTAEPDIFGMVEALASGDGGKAQLLLHRFLENGDAWSTWGMIVRQFRLLLLAREVIDARGGKSQVQKALGVHEYVAEKAFEQAQRFTLPALENIYHRLLEIDVAAKTGRMPLEIGMEILVVELAR